ncbi:MAG: response regulator [Chitinophagaceae bacterium]
MPIHIAIVDDKPLNRQTIKQKLHGYHEIEILFEAKHGEDFLEQMKAVTVKPEVVLMDLEMPQQNGTETISIASAAYPNTKFIVLTIFEDNEKIFEAIKAGANGYLLKEDSAVNIVDAITNVHEYNGIPMSPIIARKAMELLKQLPTTSITNENNDAKINELSSREIDVLKELSTGKNYKAIGETLFISPMTVRKHVSNIYTKLHISSKAQLINIAHKKKWL